jgi:phage head maturation protease
VTARTVTAYGTTWAPIVRGQNGKPRLLRVARTALDGWLAAVRPGDIPVLFGHRSEVGRFTGFTLDETGIRTTAEYDRSSLADDLLTEMRAGRLAAYSVRLRFTAPA